MKEHQTDSRFVQFTSLAYGFRAAFIQIRTYMRRDGLCSISQIVSKWAPPFENNTSLYIATVERFSGIKRDEMLQFSDRKQMISLVRAMAYMENGTLIFGDSIERGYDMVIVN